MSNLIDPQRGLLEELARQHPALRSLLEEHRRDHDRDLSYVFMGDVEGWAVAQYLEGDTQAVADLLSFLEIAYLEGDEDARTLIALGFVEAMPGGHEPAAEMRSLLGPALRAEYRRLRF